MLVGFSNTLPSQTVLDVVAQQFLERAHGFQVVATAQLSESKSAQSPVGFAVSFDDLLVDVHCALQAIVAQEVVTQVTSRITLAGVQREGVLVTLFGTRLILNH